MPPGLTLAVEGCVLAILGWAWLALRDLLGPPPLLESVVLYGGLVVAVCNLGLASVAPDSRLGVYQAHLGIHLALWLLLMYGLADALGDTAAVSTGGACCPNLAYPQSTRRLLFGGLTYYLAPGAITLGFQTVQVLVAAGAVITDTHASVWPGHGFALAALALLGALASVRFLVLTPPCPDGSFVMLFGLSHANYGYVFVALSGAGLALLALEPLVEKAPPIRLALRAGQLAVASFLGGSLAYALQFRGMLTDSTLFLLGTCWAVLVYAVFEPCRPADAQELAGQTAACLRGSAKRRLRFVVPVSTHLETKKRD